MKIGDVCKLLDISRATLRRWEKVGLIHFERRTLGSRIIEEAMIPQIQKIIKERNKANDEVWKKGGNRRK